jgi:large subunit ribosomal protein L22
MKALLTNYHQSPRKVGLVAGVIRGKSVAAAQAALAFLPQKSAPDIAKLLNSAVANARQSGQSEENLFVKTITVNKGMVMRRFKPMARGRAARYAKTMSHVAIELGTRAPKNETAKTEKVAAKRTAAKKTTKKAATKAE